LSRKNISFAGFIICLIGSLLFSTKAIIVKLAFADSGVDALTLLTIRMAFSLPFFLAAAFWSANKNANAKLGLRQYLQIVLLGLFGYYLSSYFDFVGLQYISAGLERLILFLYPSIVVLINAFFFRQRITRIQLIALLLTYLGIGLAYYGEMQFDAAYPNFVWGSMLIFLCSITYAIYIAGSGRIIPHIGPSRFTAYSMLAATAGIFIHFGVSRNYTELMATAGIWQYGLLLAIAATVLPTFLIAAGMSRIGSNNVAIISSIGPVSTILQAHWLLGEPIHGGQITGTVLVIAGVLLTGWKSGATQIVQDRR